MPRKRHVSRNLGLMYKYAVIHVMPRKRHVSRNVYYSNVLSVLLGSCLARGM